MHILQLCQPLYRCCQILTAGLIKAKCRRWNAPRDDNGKARVCIFNELLNAGQSKGVVAAEDESFECLTVWSEDTVRDVCFWKLKVVRAQVLVGISCISESVCVACLVRINDSQNIPAICRSTGQYWVTTSRYAVVDFCQNARSILGTPVCATNCVRAVQVNHSL